MNDDYSDIIHLPHHVSAVHPQMPLEARAAQFAPFAALTGYEDAIGDTARTSALRNDPDRQAPLEEEALPEILVEPDDEEEFTE
ncbi:MAG: hypothetical protein K6F98_01550 [Bacteroidales bacterium]|nr:hypothetical protein [Bacteroidales bacterium]